MNTPKNQFIIQLLIAFLVLAFISCDNREWNNPFDPECPKELFTPAGFTSKQEGNLVKLTWTQSNTQISGFAIERTIDGGATWSSVATPSKTELTWSDNNITAGKEHKYRLVAKAGINRSNEVTAQVTPLFAATLTTLAVTSLTTNSATSGGNITSDGGAPVTARGVCWSTSPNPTTANNKTSDGTGTGSFTSNIAGLTENTTFYVRAYAINSQTTVYGSEVSFKTNQTLALATLTTTAVTTFTSTTAILGGNVTNDGNATVTERGVVYASTQNPTTANTKVAMGTGIGTFSNAVSGLTANTTYYVRSYAINGQGTAYGNPEVSFKTSVNFYDIEMIIVEGGTFQMGSTTGYNNEQPVHSVTLSSYYISKTEVTQALWLAVMGSNPSSFKGDNLPVESVSWNDIQTFITKLNEQSGLNYRLPTEAEWEYAARGGKNSKGYTYAGSNILGDVAWYVDNSGNSTHLVTTKTANELGLFDMSGNVWEWCADLFGSYSSAAQTNPTGSSTGSDNVIRGGGWNRIASFGRVAFRFGYSPDFRDVNLGFRLARSL